MQNLPYSPGTLQYIPVFYVIWSDDLLSDSEIAVVNRAISNDSGLGKAEQEVLRAWLDRNNPPSDKLLKEWQQLIADSGVTLIAAETYPLAAFSRKMVCHYLEDCPFNEALSEIEVNLGIQPNHYQHLFEVEMIQEPSSGYYSARELDQLLNVHTPATQTIRTYLTKPDFQWEPMPDKDVFRLKVLKQLQLLAGEGFGAIAYPEAAGGQDDFMAYATIFEQLMYISGSLAVKFGVQFGLFGGSIHRLGTENHLQYLKAAGKGELLGCFAMTETRHGSNVRGIRTTATYDSKRDMLVINTPGKNDNKEYIGNALHASMATVFAQLIVDGKNEGVHAILLNIRDPEGNTVKGVKVEDNGYKLGLNGVDNGKIWFRQVEVPRQNLLNRYGSIDEKGHYQSPIQDPNKRFFTMLGTLVGGRICVAKGALSGARMSLAIAVKYALRRRQFNDSVRVQEDLIMDYPTHQLRLTPPIAKTYVYNIALDQLMRQYADESNQDRRELETQVAALKATVSWFANDTIQECREACGGKGYLLENRIGGLKSDVDIFTTFEGDNTVLMQLAAKGILSDFKSEFNSDNFVSVIRLLGNQLGARIAAVNPLYTQKVDKDHLYNPKFHMHAFHYRRSRLTYTLAMRIRKYMQQGMPSYQAFLKVQTHFLALGKAYSAELSYQLFQDYAENMPEGKYRELFTKLGVLFALDEIRNDAAWYQEQGYLGGRKSRAVSRRVERLCTELRPHLETLVEGFGIPEKVLNAPIATS